MNERGRRMNGLARRMNGLARSHDGLAGLTGEVAELMNGLAGPRMASRVHERLLHLGGPEEGELIAGIPKRGGGQRAYRR